MKEYKVSVQQLIDHIKTAIDVDPWAKEMAEDLLNRCIPKKRESRAKLQCLCGRKQFETWYIASGGVEIRCPGCGIAASGDSEIAAIRAWNAMIIDARSHLKAIREEERR